MPDRATSLNPEPGFFRLRLVKNGPWVAARIVHEPTRDPLDDSVLDRSPLWRGDIDWQTDENPSPSPTEAVMRIWLWGERVTAEEFNFLRQDAEWARAYDDTDPRANPRKSVNIREIKAIVP